MKTRKDSDVERRIAEIQDELEIKVRDRFIREQHAYKQQVVQELTEDLQALRERRLSNDAGGIRDEALEMEERFTSDCLVNWQKDLRDMEEMMAHGDPDETFRKIQKLGHIHAIWAIQKDILRKDYGIDWKSPAEEHPDINFD